MVAQRSQHALMTPLNLKTIAPTMMVAMVAVVAVVVVAAVEVVAAEVVEVDVAATKAISPRRKPKTHPRPTMRRTRSRRRL